MILSRVTRSEAAAPGADTRLVMFEGSSAGKNMVSFTTGGDLLMGRNIIRRWTTDKLDHYIYIQNLVLFTARSAQLEPTRTWIKVR